MTEKLKRNNFITHQIGLHYVAYLLSKRGFRLEIDYSVSEHGHLKVNNGHEKVLLLSKTLSDLVPVPFTRKEVDSLNEFKAMIVCVGAYDNTPTLYEVPIEIVKERIKHNVGTNGELDYWLDVDKYKEMSIVEPII